MPETPEQVKQITHNTHAFKRGGHKALIAKKKAEKIAKAKLAASSTKVVRIFNTKANEYMLSADAKLDPIRRHVVAVKPAKGT